MTRFFFLLGFLLLAHLAHFFNPISATNEHERVFRVPESVPQGHHIGFVRGESGEPLEAQDKQNFFIVYAPEGNGITERTIRIDERTGEIALRPGQSLDREAAHNLHILAIPVDGSDPIGILIEILDENDNAPLFGVDSVRLEISEYARINTEMSLPMATDGDSGKFGIQRYRIASGNVNNAFRLSHSADGHFLDLVVNGQLDREYRARYELVVEAVDGGKPPKVGTLRVQVDVLDANDNPPEFVQQHYAARIGQNTGPGIPIVRLAAKDPDMGQNGRITYSITAQSILGHPPPPSSPFPPDLFQIDPQSGTLSLRHPLPPNLLGPTIFELIISAKDQGIPEPLETTATVQIVAEGTRREDTGGEGGGYRLGVIWLTEDGTAENVPEGLPLGQVLARVSVEGGSGGGGMQKDDHHQLRLSLLGAQSAICLRQTDSGAIYLLVVCGQLDREKMPALQMDLLLRNGTSAAAAGHNDGDDVLLDHPIHLALTDVNDNAPAWNSTNFQFEWPLDEEEEKKEKDGGGCPMDGRGGGGMRRMVAKDGDSGENARIRYKVVGTDLFGIDSETGELCQEKQFPPSFCPSENVVHFQVDAEDHGQPPLSARTNVSIRFVRVHPAGESAQIRFRQSLYEVTIPEDIRPNTCILQVSAVDNAFCAGPQNSTTISSPSSPASLHYWLSDGPLSKLFKLDANTGVLCTKEWLDFEKNGENIQLEALVANEQGSEASAELLIRLEDINDHSPSFHPREYAVLLSPDALDPSIPLLAVRAIDLDASEKFNAINYELGEGVGIELFRMDRQSGELRLSELGAKKLGMVEEGEMGMYGMELRVEAKDGGGRQSEEMALIRVRLLPAHFHCMSFSERIYRFKVPEETLPGIGLGDLRVLDVTDVDKVRFEIVREERRNDDHRQQQQQWDGTGEEDGRLFAFDEGRPNRLVLERELDGDKAGGQTHLLNIKAIDGVRNCTNFTQIRLEVVDANDNGPEFGVDKMHVEIAEDQPIHVPFFALKARDRDRGENGRISYELVSIHPPASLPLLVHSETGALSLSAPLDADGGDGQNATTTFSIQLRALDHGIPQRQAQISLHLTLLDVNDNSPQFGQPEYSIEVPENSEMMQIVLRVEAKDADRTAINNRVRYGMAQLVPVIQGEGEEVLGVNWRTGEVFVRHQLDREHFEEYTFELTASDGGNPPRNGTARLHVRVLDVNDNAPNCSAQTRLNVSRGQKAGERIGQVEASDPDKGPNGIVRFRLQQPNALLQLTANGEFFLRQEIAKLEDPSSGGALSIAVIAEDQSMDGAPLSTVCQVVVQIENGSETAAEAIQFIGPIQREIWLDQAASVGTELVKVNGTTNGGLVSRWSLEENALSQYFVIGPEGSVLLAKSPDAELAQLIDDGRQKLVVRMETATNSTKLMAFRLRRQGSREKEAATEWKKRGVELVTLPANWSIWRQIPIFQMMANQSGDGKQFFQLEGADEEAEKMMEDGLFELDQLNGALFLADWPPLLNGTSAALRISAYPREDDAGASIEFDGQMDRLVTVEMTEWIGRRREARRRPKCAKLFEQWNASESAPIGNVLGKVDILEENGGRDGRQFRFELVEDGGGTFEIGARSGEIYTKMAMKRKEEMRHILVIKVSEEGEDGEGDGLTSNNKCVRQVNVLEEEGEGGGAANPPTFLSHPNCTLFMANLEKGLYPAGNVFHHFVVNQQNDHQIAFKIVAAGHGAASDAFHVGKHTGALSVPNPSILLPANISSSFRLTIKASSGNFSSTQIFTIRLDRTGQRQFAFFDRRQFVAKVQMAEGGGGGSGQRSQFVANLRRKDGPDNVELSLLPALPGFHFEKAEDDGSGGSLLYTEPPNGLSQIGGNLTMIVIAKPTNSSSSSTFDHAQVDIVPMRPRRGPKIEPTSCGNLSVPEGMEIDDLLRVRLVQNGTMEGAAEEGTATGIVFAIEGGNWHSLFSVDPKSGWLSSKALDRETKGEHLLMISATDLASLPRKVDVCSVRIQVIDRNDNAPKLTTELATQLELPKDAKIGHILAKLTATDPDEGQNGRVVYVMDKDPSEVFDLEPESGELTFARETPFLFHQSMVWISVRAIDRGQPKSLASEPMRIRIEWAKREEEGKRRGMLAFSRRRAVADIWEGLPRGQLVAKLELVNNVSASSPIGFTIVSGNFDSAFLLDSSGHVRTSVELDAEIRALYSLHILAYSSDGQRAECRLDIRVLDREDNGPAIRRMSQLRILENTPVGMLIASVSANDVDAISTSLEYSFVTPNGDHHFEIGRWTGRVHLAKPLDFETQRRHELRVQASDGINRSFANFTVEVLDANDNAPQFDRPFLELELSRNAPVGTLLAKLEAKDADGTERNSRISYELVEGGGGEGGGGGWFTLDRNTGELRLAKSIVAGGGGNGNHHFGAHQLATVKAIDSGRPPLFSYCTILVVVIQSNNNNNNNDGAAFRSQTFNFSISEHSPPNLPIGQVALFHSPTPLNCDFRLLFSPPNSSLSALFRIDFAGTIFVNGSLDREALGEFVQMEATFSRCPTPSNSAAQSGGVPRKAAVRIHILDVNDNWPEFVVGEWPEKMITIGEGMEKGRLVAKINAIDRDPSPRPNAPIFYTILTGDPRGMFQMDREKGELRFDHWEEEEMAEENGAELVIGAQDWGMPRRSTAKLVRIGMERAAAGNGTSTDAVGFGVPIYRKFIEETTPPGSVLFTVKLAREENDGKMRYSMENEREEETAILSIDPSTGRIILTAPLDMEAERNGTTSCEPSSPFMFNVTARNGLGIVEGRVPVEIYLIGVDEFPPVFTKNAYTFKLPSSPALGQPIGHVLALDKDVGIGNKVRYLLDPADLLAAQYVSVEPRNGTLSLVGMPTGRRSNVENGTENDEPTVIRLTIWAESGWRALDSRGMNNGKTAAKMMRTSATVYIEIGPSPPPPSQSDSPQWPSSAPPHYFIPLLILPFLLLLLCCLSALLLAKLFLRSQRLPAKSAETDFLRPTPKKRVFTVSACRQLEMEKRQQQQRGGMGMVCRTLSPSFESGQFSQGRRQGNMPLESAAAAPSSTNPSNYMNMAMPLEDGPASSSSRHHPLPIPSCASRRSQPDSGIDPDRISSTGSEASETTTRMADEYLRRLGVEEAAEGKGGRKKREEERERGGGAMEEKDPEESFLDELIYAPLEEIFGHGEGGRKNGGGGGGGMMNGGGGLSGQAAIIGGRKLERMIPSFKPLSQVLGEMIQMERADSVNKGSQV